MRLTILGTSTPFPRLNNACSGYLVQSGRISVWVDAGTGTLAQLQRHLDLASLDAIWISHAHADHTADLLAAYHALRFSETRRTAPLPLIGPADLLDRMAAFLGGSSQRRLPEVFDFTAMKRAGRHEFGELSLRWHSVSHGMPSFGLRVESAEATLTYSGDSAYCDSLVELARGASAFLCEVGSSGSSSEGSSPIHCTPEDAGRLAGAAEVERLIVTHIGEGMSAEQAADRAQAAFPGPVDIARPGHLFDFAARSLF